MGALPLRLRLRTALASDGLAVGSVFTAARAGMTYLPQLHTPAEDVAYFSEQVVGAAGMAVVVADVDGEVVGFGAVGQGWLHHLYVLPTYQGQGIGSGLLDWAKSEQAGGLLLWVFEENEDARRLYRRAGFVEVERTDGRSNMEHVPDIRMRWSPPVQG